jgi:V/A-type H+-transporting ATPase subunit E
MGVKNGISAIANDVINDVQKEAETIICAAENEAKATMKSAKEEADQIYGAIINQAKATVEAEKRKISSKTEVEIRNQLLQMKEDLVDIAFEKAFVELKNFVETKSYNDYLIKLIQSTVEKMVKKDVSIQVNSKDRKLLTPDLLKSLSRKCSCELRLSEKTEGHIGGCIIQTEDGKIIYDATLDNRMQELKPILRVDLAKILFGEAV